MIQKFEDWKLNEGVVDVKKSYDAIHELKSTLRNIVSEEIDNLENLVKNFRIEFQKLGIEFWWNKVDILEDSTIGMHGKIEIYFKNREKKDFQEAFAKFYDPNDWKGVHISESIDDAHEDLKKMIDEISREMYISYKIGESRIYRPQATIAQVAIEVVVFKKNLASDFINIYAKTYSGSLAAKKYGI